MEALPPFNSRRQHAKAIQVGNNLLQSQSVQFMHVDTALFYKEWAYFQRHQDEDYSRTACISFLVTQKLVHNQATFWGIIRCSSR
jgi:hypothetical protein